MDNLKRHKAVFLWVVLFGAVIAGTLNNTMPYKGDESFYITSAIGMVENGDYLVPRYFGEMRFQKPVLSYWLTAGGYLLFGVHLWSGRVLYLLMACGFLLLVYRLALVVSGELNHALLSVMVLSSSTLYFGFARHAMTDLPFAFFMTAALYFFCRILGDSSHISRDNAFAFLMMSLAVMSKSVIGFMPAVAFFVYLFLRRPDGWVRYIRALFHPLNIVIVALIVLPWYICVYKTEPAEFMRQMSYEADAASGGAMAVPYNLMYYVISTLVMMFPAFGAALFVGFRKRVSRLPLSRSTELLLVYSVLMVLFFTVFIGRARERYLLAMFPALAILVSLVLYRAGRAERYMKIAAVVFALHGVVFLAYPLISGEPLRSFVSYCRESGDGEIAVHGFDRKRTSWVQAMSGGSLAEDPRSARYLIVKGDNDSLLVTHEEIMSHSRINRVTYRDGRFQTKYKTFRLMRNKSTVTENDQ